MIETQCLTIRVKNEADMKALGAIIGEHIFDPRLYPQENLIVCAYGVKGGGKSTLLWGTKHALLNTAESGATPRADIKVISRDFAWGFDCSTYPDDDGLTDVSGTEEMFAMINNNGSAVHLFEHSPVNVLAQGNIGIVISWPAQPVATAYGRRPRMNDFYLNAMADNLDSSARETGLEDGAVAKVVDQMHQAGKDVCRNPAKRIVRLFPLSDTPEIQKAFQKTREEIMNTRNLSIIDSEPLGLLARLKQRVLQFV